MSGLAIEPLNPASLPAAAGNYAHGVQVDGAQRQHAPALTVIICDIYAEAWLLEIDAVAMA